MTDFFPYPSFRTPTRTKISKSTNGGWGALGTLLTSGYQIRLDICHSLEWPIFRYTIDPNSLSVCLFVCLFVCLSVITNEKVKGFPLVSFVMTFRLFFYPHFFSTFLMIFFTSTFFQLFWTYIIFFYPLFFFYPQFFSTFLFFYPHLFFFTPSFF